MKNDGMQHTDSACEVQEPATSTTYKDRLFRLIFREKEELLSLYNAINRTNYTNPDDLIVNTLENAIYMGMRNDLSFIIDDRMSLYEHQSTINPNLPLRNLNYVSDLYSAYTEGDNLYGRTLIKLPTPHFVVLYNGRDEQPERQVMRLSEAFTVQEDEKYLELQVLVLNINPGFNEKLMNRCKTLRDYMCYVDKVRTYAETMSLAEAVDRAIKECIEDDVLAKFLRKYRAEAKKVSIYEYDEERHMKQIAAEARTLGIEEGKQIGIEIGKAEAEKRFETEREKLEDKVKELLRRLDEQSRLE